MKTLVRGFSFFDTPYRAHFLMASARVHMAVATPQAVLEERRADAWRGHFGPTSCFANFFNPHGRGLKDSLQNHRIFPRAITPGRGRVPKFA